MILCYTVLSFVKEDKVSTLEKWVCSFILHKELNLTEYMLFWDREQLQCVLELDTLIL